MELCEHSVPDLTVFLLLAILGIPAFLSYETTVHALPIAPFEDVYPRRGEVNFWIIGRLNYISATPPDCLLKEMYKFTSPTLGNLCFF